MKKTENKINTKRYEQNKTILQQKKNYKKIEELQAKLESEKKTTFEKTIEFITFGLVNYTKKYKKITSDIDREIQALKSSLKILDTKLKKLNDDIELLKKEFDRLQKTFKKKLVLFQNKLLKITDDRYINHYTQDELLDEAKRLVGDNETFLNYHKIRGSVAELVSFYDNPDKWTENKNIDFIKKEKIREKEFFDTVESKPLTDRQKDAVLVNENNNLVIAGAGSGKTSVIVAKVSYLLKKKILAPNEILVLAFNKNAQEELDERFKQKNIHITIKTFHSFGLSIIAQALNQKPDLCPISESSQNMTKFIKDTIEELIVSMGPFFKKLLEFRAYFKIPYKSESDFKSLGEYYEYQKNYDMKTFKHEVEVKNRQNDEILLTLKNETVKSHQEFVIANYLTLNGIKYSYEEPYKYKTYTIKHRQYKPDFYLPVYDIYIEHFGIDRKGGTAPYIDNKSYLESMKWKRDLHEKNGTTMIETFSYEFTEGKLLENLKEKLLRHNVEYRELEQSEMRELLKDDMKDDGFTKLFTTFMSHYKSNMHSMRELDYKSKEIERTSLFLTLFKYIFNEYEKFQNRNQCIDFDDMIVKALASIEKGKYKHGFKHIFIDEFQDISTTRAKLISALLPINKTSITAVGDDWQSINRFAGSNIKIIQDFEKTFGISKTVKLDYTFRFNDEVSKIASKFIQKNPHQIQKDIKTIKKQLKNKHSILLFWTTGNIRGDIEKVLNIIAKKEKDSNKKIMILARYRFLLKDLQYLIKKYHQYDLILNTVHSSKGNEADYVIILNMENGKYGFPSKIEDDPILDIVIPEGDDFTDAEERRLFYVGMTRTKDAVFLLSDMYNRSAFINELLEDDSKEIFILNKPKAEPMHCPECKTGFLKKREYKNKEPSDKSRYFYGCSNFPRCDYTENIHYCPICNSEMIKGMENKKGYCSNDECDFETTLCSECNGYMIERRGQYGTFLGCSNYPKCRHSENVYNR